MPKPDYANMPQSEPQWSRAGKVVKHVKGEDKYSDIDIMPILGFHEDGQPRFASVRKIRVFAPLVELVKGSIICGCVTFQQNGKYINATMGAVFRRDGSDWIRVPSASGNAHKATEPTRPEPWPDDESSTIKGAPATQPASKPVANKTVAQQQPWAVRLAAVDELLDRTHAMTAAFLERHEITCGDAAWMEMFKYVGMCLKIDADGWDDSLTTVAEALTQGQKREPDQLPPDSDIPF